jgi:predicted enzyme related to lactoylglutathione lyase
MAETTAIATGTIIWVDLASNDMEATKSFYGGLFGWAADTSPEPEYGGYTMFRKDGKMVAAAAPAMSAEQPEQWTSYVGVDDARATAAKVAEAGGRVLMEPMDIPKSGTMAVLMDPTGAVIALWQPGEHKGAELSNSPGSVGWNELSTRDVPKAAEFYRAVFGWGTETNGEGAAAYTEFKLGERHVGGMINMDDKELPQEIPPHWLPYFMVENCAASAAKAEQLGGKVMKEPTKVPEGTFAVITDPRGAAFAIISD